MEVDLDMNPDWTPCQPGTYRGSGNDTIITQGHNDKKKFYMPEFLFGNLYD